MKEGLNGEVVVYVRLVPPRVSSPVSSLSVKCHIRFHEKLLQVQTSSTKSESVYIFPPNVTLAAVIIL